MGRWSKWKFPTTEGAVESRRTRRGSWRLFLPELASALDAKTAGKYSITARATDEKGNVQPDEAVWNAGGYLWNKIEKQELVAGKAN